MHEDHPLLRGLGDAVRVRRRARGWSRRELAERTQISERFLADVERGRANPSVLRLAEIARVLETTAATLLAATPAPAEGTQRCSVALLGLRGAGKSSVGAALAARLDCPFVEVDVRVEERVGLTLSEIFEVHGPDYYRRAEREVLAGMLAGDAPRVLATGGGAVTEAETWQLLRDHAHTVWLKARPEDHWTRVVAQGDLRPMEGDQRAFAHLCAILSEREKLYQQAEVTVDTTGREVEEIAGELALRYAFLRETVGQ